MIGWIVKNIFLALFWVFVLSIDYNGRPFFYTAHKVMIDNPLAQKIDLEIRSVWASLVDDNEFFSDSSQSSDKTL